MLIKFLLKLPNMMFNDFLGIFLKLKFCYSGNNNIDIEVARLCDEDYENYV